MSVTQTDVVDWLGIEKGSGYVGLTVVDDLDWVDEQRHLLLLQLKLNTYLRFVESGEVFQQLLQKVGRRVSVTTPVKVTILAKFELTPRSRKFVEHAIETFESAGLLLTHKVL